MSPLLQSSRSILTASFNRKLVITTAQRSFLSTYFNSTFGDDSNGIKSAKESSSTAVGKVYSKGDMINMIAEEYEMTKAQSGRIVNTIFDTVMEEVSNNRKVSISGFGTFQSKDRKERNFTSPLTGKKMVLPATKKVKFTAYKSFKDVVAK